MTWAHFKRGSSPVDWCEENYLISSNIAEFVNTISNILFIVLPPILITLFRNYGKYVNKAIHIIWIMLFIVGVSSAYFHATLSLIGQLLDEVAILWVFMAGLSIFYPERYMPNMMIRQRKLFYLVIFALTIFATGLSFLHPALNAFVLMFLALPAIFLLYQELMCVHCPRVYRLGIRCTCICILAVVCWVNDRLFCDVWSYIKFPYLHALWHILIFISSYTACVLFSYFNVIHNLPDKLPILKYWPKNTFEFGIPYVTIKGIYKNTNDQI